MDSTNKLNKMCRICLNLDTNLVLADIYEISILFGSPIIEVLLKCAPIHIRRDDGLPSFICQPCLSELLKFHQFQLRALESEKILHQYRKSQNTSVGSALVSNLISRPPQNDSENLNIKLERQNDESSDYIISDSESKQSLECSIKIKNEIQLKSNKISSENVLYSENVIKNIKKESDVLTKNLDEELNSEIKATMLGVRIKSRRRNNPKQLIKKISSSDVLQFDISNKKRYQCQICDRYFSRKYHLSDHQRQHTGEKPFQCDDCGHCFSRQCALNVHKRKHTGEKPYQCDVCKKCFAQIDGLTGHKRIHTGEKPYQCDVCSKCFARKVQLRKHKRTHTNEKPYQCGICEKRFSENGNLSAHKRLHTGEKPYQCDVCSKCFTKNGNLVTHKRIHTGEKPYQCNICEKCFADRSSFESHKRHHSGERSYQCEVCSKCFVHKSNLNTHKRMHIDREKVFENQV